MQIRVKLGWHNVSLVLKAITTIRKGRALVQHALLVPIVIPPNPPPVLNAQKELIVELEAKRHTQIVILVQPVKFLQQELLTALCVLLEPTPIQLVLNALNVRLVLTTQELGVHQAPTVNRVLLVPIVPIQEHPHVAYVHLELIIQTLVLIQNLIA